MHQEFLTEDLLQGVSAHPGYQGSYAASSGDNNFSANTRLGVKRAASHRTVPCLAPGRPRLAAGLSPPAGTPRKVSGASAKPPPGGISQRRGRARSRPLLQLPRCACKSGGGGKRGRGEGAERGSSGVCSSGAAGGRQGSAAGRHRHRHSPGCPGVAPPGPAAPGGASGSGGAAPGPLRPQRELLCASAGEARAFRAPTAVTLFALAVNSLRLPPPRHNPRPPPLPQS